MTNAYSRSLNFTAKYMYFYEVLQKAIKIYCLYTLAHLQKPLKVNNLYCLNTSDIVYKSH